jgi:PAS domain S-box-containing protein
VTAVRDDSGQIVGFLGVATDITERKKAENELKEAARRYHELLEGSSDGYIMMSADGKIIEYNSIFRKMLGYSDDELSNKNIKELMTPEGYDTEIKIITEQVLKRINTKRWANHQCRNTITINERKRRNINWNMGVYTRCF